MKNKSQANSLVLLPTSSYFWDDGGGAIFCRKMIQKRYAVSRSQSSSGFKSLAIKFSRPVIARFKAVPSVNLARYLAKTFFFFPPFAQTANIIKSFGYIILVVDPLQWLLCCLLVILDKSPCSLSNPILVYLVLGNEKKPITISRIADECCHGTWSAACACCLRS